METFSSIWAHFNYSCCTFVHSFLFYVALLLISLDLSFVSFPGQRSEKISRYAIFFSRLYSISMLCFLTPWFTPETPLNGIEIPELLRNEISDGSSKVIDSVRNYLLDLGRASPPDVRTYLQQNRFSLPDPVIATTALPVRKDKMVEETVQDLQKLTVNRTGKVGPAATTTTTTTTTPTTVVEKSNNLTSDGGSISPRTRLYVVSVEEMVVVLRDSDGRVVVTAEVDDSKRSIGSSVEYGSLKRVVRVSFVDS